MLNKIDSGSGAMQTINYGSFEAHRRFVLGIAVWIGCVAAGFIALMVYSHTPGVTANPPNWDSEQIPFALPDNQYLLVMGVHPKCPCTRASIGELEKLLRRAEGKLSCCVLVYQPANVTSDWQQTDLISSVQNLADTQMIFDPEGALAAQFSMSTSGAVVLYSAAGEPVFHGGITASRGHHGDNLGSDSILAILDDTQPETTQTAVYGCLLHSRSSTCSVKGQSCCKEGNL